MKRRVLLSLVALAGSLACDSRAEAPEEAVLKTAVESYFNDLFQRLEKAAGEAPTEETFRDVMRPRIEKVDGLFGATLINADWEIRAVYFKRDFLAVGFSLKKVKELDGFRARMAENPAPQLSEPGHGNIMQPRLIALRYPMLKEGKMTGMVSMMIRTESFLKAVGLKNCKAYKITCQGKDAESEGALSEKRKEIRVALPSTEWVIRYE
ncbi:MAG: hypothetical protein RBT78_04760 [Kiritimatiellia bacterium]|jgi:hypothetical protein|nr:hypothetical protein [Kiritimatiellia bacterium]